MIAEALWRLPRGVSTRAGAVADMCVVDVPVTSIVETIDTVARHGAGRVIETVVSGRVRYSASR